MVEMKITEFESYVFTEDTAFRNHELTFKTDDPETLYGAIFTIDKCLAEDKQKAELLSLIDYMSSGFDEHDFTPEETDMISSACKRELEEWL
jgi:hypothetical protein